MATTSIADKLAKLEKKIAKREKTIADETKELDKDRAEYNKLYIMFLSDKYKLSGKELFSAIEREHEQLEKLRDGGMSDSDIDSLTDNAPADKDKAILYEDCQPPHNEQAAHYRRTKLLRLRFSDAL